MAAVNPYTADQKVASYADAAEARAVVAEVDETLAPGLGNLSAADPKVDLKRQHASLVAALCDELDGIKRRITGTTDDKVRAVLAKRQGDIEAALARLGAKRDGGPPAPVADRQGRAVR